MKQYLAFIAILIPLATLANPKQNSSVQEILVHNKIKPKMLEYNFLKTSYSPDSFKIRINNKEIKPGATISLPKTEKMIVRYEYSFAKGWRTGAKEIVFDLDPQKHEFNLEFSWDNKWRIIADGAKPKKAIKVKYQS